MELRQLKYFLTLSETGNFARAAAREHITQSALSQQVARLERELGVVLFERTPRGSVLTRAGQEILALAQGVLTQVGQLESYARSIGRGMTGELRIGSPMYGVSNPARHAIEQTFRHRVPGVELLFENDWSAALARRLQSGQLDLAFTMIGERDAELEKQPVHASPGWVVLPEDDELTRAEHVRAEDLSGRRVLIYPHSLSSWIHERLAVRLAEVGAEAVELREPTLPAAMAQVRQGDGVFLAVPWEVPLVHADLMQGLVTRPTTPETMLTYGLWLARRESDRSSLSGAFWEVAREVARPTRDLPSAG